MGMNLINLTDSEQSFMQKIIYSFLKKSFEAIKNRLIVSEYALKGQTLDFDFDLQYSSHE